MSFFSCVLPSGMVLICGLLDALTRARHARRDETG